jgi:large subunit ribosomal protein L5
LSSLYGKVKSSSFDSFGNLSVGIHEYIDLPDTKYNPDIGIFGMDVSIALIRPGYAIAESIDILAKDTG